MSEVDNHSVSFRFGHIVENNIYGPLESMEGLCDIKEILKKEPLEFRLA